MEKLTLFNLFNQGGVVMWPILLCSIITLAVIIEKFFTLSKVKINPEKLMASIRESLAQKNIVGAIDACRQVNAPVANVLRRGIQQFDNGKEAMRQAIENSGREEIFHLEKRLSVLANMAGVAPMLGFLGTVTGMIQTFYTIQLMGGNLSPSDLAGGIWEAMLTTAFGLIVGIPALGFYNYFVSRVTRFIFEIETLTEEFLGIDENISLITSSKTTNFGDEDKETEYFEPIKE
ncbi:MAG: MotA/TolQ/ExbB proton channel family protein [Bacteroidota bacterium]